MLKKLFYHDFRALSRYMIPTVCILLGVCVLAGIFLSIYMANTEGMFEPGNFLGGLLSASVVMVYFFLVFGLMGAILAFYIIYILRVRSHMYGDEGYLTLAIPATPHEFTLSKLFSGTIWFYITAIAIVIGAIVSIFIPTLFIPGMTAGSGGGAGGTVTTPATEVIASILNIFTFLLVMPISQVMFLQATVSFGSLLAGKSHIGISILFYIGVNFALSIIQSLCSELILFGAVAGTATYGGLMLLNGLISFLMYAGLGVGTYFLNIWLLRRKINLE